MPEGHDATIEVCNIMSFVLYTQILKQSVLKPASPGITLSWTSFNKIGKTLILYDKIMFVRGGIRTHAYIRGPEHSTCRTGKAGYLESGALDHSATLTVVYVRR